MTADPNVADSRETRGHQRRTRPEWNPKQDSGFRRSRRQTVRDGFRFDYRWPKGFREAAQRRIESADEIVGEFDDDLPTIERDGESESESDAVIDVEVVADEYTDADAAIMSTRPVPSPRIKIKPN